jgi:fatty-acyl-CoA synthase
MSSTTQARDPRAVKGPADTSDWFLRVPEIRSLADIEKVEQVPLERQVTLWDANAWIRNGCARFPDKPTVIYVENGDVAATPTILSYETLMTTANRFANVFDRCGVGAGEPVLVLLPTIPALYPVIVGAMAAGIICCCNWMLEPVALLRLIKTAKPKVIIALGPSKNYMIWEKLQQVLPDVDDQITVFSIAESEAAAATPMDLHKIARDVSPKLSFERPRVGSDIAAYIHSGGTTGAPKLVKVTHRAVVYKSWATTVTMDYRPSDVVFSEYPLFHVAGMLSRGLLPLMHGMTSVIPSPLGAREKRFIANYWAFVERFGVTFMSGVPTTLSVLAELSTDRRNVRSLRPYATSGSTAMPASTIQAIRARTGIRIFLTYGSTEFALNVTQAPRDGELREGSNGIRLPFSEIRIVKLTRSNVVERDCEAGEPGVVIVRSPGNTPGYVDASYDNGLFVDGDWIASGDIGKLDAQGYLWITGRLKDIIIRGGHNIDPRVIEDVLALHPAVRLTAAVAKPDAYSGELPVAFVELVAGAKIEVETLKAFVKDNIGERAAVPVDIFVLDELPLTDVRKPNKSELRRRAAKRAVEQALGVVGVQANYDISIADDGGLTAVIGASERDCETVLDVFNKLNIRSVTK